MEETKGESDLILLEHIIFNLAADNLNSSIQSTIKLFDKNLPNSFNNIICKLIYASFLAQVKNTTPYFDYLKEIEKLEEITENPITKMFSRYILSMETQESYYLLTKMIEYGLISSDCLKDKNSLYFAQYKTKEEIEQMKNCPFNDKFFSNIEKLSKNDWELHKQFVNERINTNELAKIIRNDNVEKLQEITSQTNFDFDQTIEPSLYEVCSFINQKNISLIDYAAFFGAIKCFKLLLLNGSVLSNVGKYAIAGGHLEIIHLCEQNSSSFEDAYETAIEYHRNDIFYYFYENEIVKADDKHALGKKCIEYSNYEIFSFLKQEGMEIDDVLLREAAIADNVFLIKCLNKFDGKEIPKDILPLSASSGNTEVVKYIIQQGGVDINAKNI